MRILVNDIAASSGGALSILKSFYEFAKEDKKNEYIFLLSDEYIKETDNIRIIRMANVKKWINRLVFDLFTGKKIVNNLKVDAIFSLQNTAIFGVNIKQVIYVHQPIPFQNVKKFSFLKKEERKLMIVQHMIGAVIKKSIKKAEYTIVQTKWMKRAIIEKTKIDKDRIIIISPEIKTSNNINLSQRVNQNKFFYPTSKVIYKNYDCIIKASEIIDKEKKEEYEEYKVELTLEGTSNNRHVEYIGELKYDEVQKKYRESILVFPSYIETFGLPLKEAQIARTIILASDCEFSREVLEDYDNAYFFNPFKPEELAELMKKCINGKIRNEISKKIINYNNKSSNWEKAINLLQ